MGTTYRPLDGNGMWRNVSRSDRAGDYVYDASKISAASIGKIQAKTERAGIRSTGSTRRWTISSMNCTRKITAVPTLMETTRITG